MHFTISENFEETMGDRVKKGVEREVAGKWTIQLVHGLHHLHTHGFFHRFIHSFSVFVTAEDNVLIGHFRHMVEAEQCDKRDIFLQARLSTSNSVRACETSTI